MTLRKRDSHPLAGRREFRTRLGQRKSSGQPTEHLEGRFGGGTRISGRQTKRNPVMMTDGECEPLGHDANDRGRGAVEVNGAAHEVRVRVEAATPLVVSDDDHRRRVWTFIFVVQRPPPQRRNSHQAEAGGSDRGDTHQVGPPVRGDQIATVLTKRAELRDRPQRGPPLEEIMRGQAGPPAGVRAGDRSGLDRHRAIAIVHRQRRIQHGAEDAEVVAPIAIASARPMTATADSPGYLASIRIPSFRSSQDTFTKILRSSAARSARSREVQTLRTRATLPNRSIAASRATCGLIP